MSTVCLGVTTPAASLDHNEEDCPFCKAKEKPDPLENKLLDKDPAEKMDAQAKADVEPPIAKDIAIAYQKFKNDSSLLTTALRALDPNLGSAMEITIKGKKFTSQTAAHHLIPGNGSFKPSTLFKAQQYLWKDGKVGGNIGYNVNDDANGVFLPGCYAYLGRWGSGGAKFDAIQEHKDAGVDAKLYAEESIKQQGKHFHNAHSEYNTFVMKVLNDINSKLKITTTVCNEAKDEKEKPPEERKPLLKLITTLNKLSAEMKKMVSGSKADWRQNIFTSGFAEDFMASSGLGTAGDAQVSDVADAALK